MKRLVVALFLSILAVPVSAEEASTLKSLASASEARGVADQAMALIRQEKFTEAYGTVKPFWPLPAVEVDGLVNQMNTQWPMVQQRYGKSLSTEFVGESKVGESFIRYTYLQKFERHALRWTFVFYRPKERWLVNSVSYDDGVSNLFD